MLNRRLLRVKAIQGVFAYRQKVNANYQLALSEIDRCFQPDLNAMDKPDYANLEYSKKHARQIFINFFKQKEEKNTQENHEILEAVEKAKDFYRNQNDKDKNKVYDFLLQNTLNIQDTYCSVLKLLVDLSALVEELETKNENKKISKDFNKSSFNLVKNKLIALLKEDPETKVALAKVKDNWLEEDSTLRQLYKNRIAKHVAYQTYQKVVNPSFEEDRKIIYDIAKKMVFKSDLLQDYFSEKDTYWSENNDIIRSMIERSIKKTEESGFSMLSLSQDWEDDQYFLNNLYYGVVEMGEELQEEIMSKFKNWDEDRVSTVDSIIIDMAVVEMIECRAIPVKVSINEYIEISKAYSTPRSKEFVNGVLDGVSKSLIKAKKIRKSGRGLIDNK